MLKTINLSRQARDKHRTSGGEKRTRFLQATSTVSSRTTAGRGATASTSACPRRTRWAPTSSATATALAGSATTSLRCFANRSTAGTTGRRTTRRTCSRRPRGVLRSKVPTLGWGRRTHALSTRSVKSRRTGRCGNAPPSIWLAVFACQFLTFKQTPGSFAKAGSGQTRGNADKPAFVHFTGRQRGRILRCISRWQRRRARVEEGTTHPASRTSPASPHF